MIINKEHFNQGGKLIARQGAMKSGCIRSLYCMQWSLERQHKAVFFNT